MGKCSGFYYINGEKIKFEKGLFLEWGNETKRNGHLNTIAIIKLEDGQVITTLPRNIKFYT